MSNRPEPMTAVERAAIGAVVAAMRRNGTCWKTICHELGMSRSHLARCLALNGNDTGMRQQTGRMRHKHDCEAQAAA